MATNIPRADSAPDEESRDPGAGGETDLVRARTCHLVEEDESRWEVIDLDLTGRRVWVTARVDDTDVPLRTFDTVLTPGTRLVWTFPDGGHLEATQTELGGDLHWERRPPFFQDDFLREGREPVE